MLGFGLILAGAVLFWAAIRGKSGAVLEALVGPIPWLESDNPAPPDPSTPPNCILAPGDPDNPCGALRYDRCNGYCLEDERQRHPGVMGAFGEM